MMSTFADANSFNQDISKWDVSRVTDMMGMFCNAKAFNQSMSNWDVSRVRDMHGMFTNAESFNQDISKWDVSRVRDMHQMFTNARSFNQDLSKWDVSRVTDMNQIFYRAKSFTQKLCGRAWKYSNATKKAAFLGSTGSIARKVCTRPCTWCIYISYHILNLGISNHSTWCIDTMSFFVSAFHVSTPFACLYPNIQTIIFTFAFHLSVSFACLYPNIQTIIFTFTTPGVHPNFRSSTRGPDVEGSGTFTHST